MLPEVPEIKKTIREDKHKEDHHKIKGNIGDQQDHQGEEYPQKCVAARFFFKQQ